MGGGAKERARRPAEGSRGGRYPVRPPHDAPAAAAGGGTRASSSAVYSNVTRRVGSPVLLSAQHTWAGAPTSRVRLYDPWGVGPAGGVALTCAGALAPIEWSGDGILSFDAPAGVDCAVAIPTDAIGVSKPLRETTTE